MLVPAGRSAVASVRAILAEVQAIRAELETLASRGTLATVVPELREQLDHLVYRGFLERMDGERLAHYPRYLKGIRGRLGKLAGAWQRDRSLAAEFAPLWQNYLSWRASRDDPGIVEYRWLLEELRVSLFAQELKTPFPVSVKRAEKKWQEIASGLPR